MNKQSLDFQHSSNAYYRNPRASALGRPWRRRAMAGMGGLPKFRLKTSNGRIAPMHESAPRDYAADGVYRALELSPAEAK
jgi:hypothetical protein